VDFHSGNLAEFDTVLRSLGLTRGGKSGAAALPVALGGQADFHGTWAGSVASPRLAGSLTATGLSVELPAASQEKSPQIVKWDSVEADGSYDAEHIAIVHGRLLRGAARIDVNGTLAAAPAPRFSRAGKRVPISRGDELPAFDKGSMVHAQVRASQVNMSDLLPLAGVDLPVTGSLDAQISVDGAMNALTGSGWAQLNDGAAYGEPFKRVRAQGSVSNQEIQLASFAAAGRAGSITGSGGYVFASGRFQGAARGAAIDLAKVERLGAMGETIGGIGGRGAARADGTARGICHASAAQLFAIPDRHTFQAGAPGQHRRAIAAGGVREHLRAASPGGGAAWRSAHRSDDGGGVGRASAQRRSVTRNTVAIAGEAGPDSHHRG
jgi:translocation and assembly module TamB